MKYVFPNYQKSSEDGLMMVTVNKTGSWLDAGYNPTIFTYHFLLAA